MRLAIGAVVLVVIAAGAWKLSDPATLVLLAAVGELGPVSGWRCATTSTYVYDPAQGSPDSAIIAQPPEVLVEQEPALAVDHVEVDLSSGEARVWAYVADDRRVFVAIPGMRQAVTYGARARTVCYRDLGDWRIVEEHAG